MLIDRIQIQQVLVNLIRNGVEAMRDEDTRELSLTTRKGNENFAQVIVRDTGPGLSEQVRKRLFEPFMTTKDAGMGIGLSICQTIVEAHGGTIEALTGIWPGAAFRFSVPLAALAS